MPKLKMMYTVEFEVSSQEETEYLTGVSASADTGVSWIENDLRNWFKEAGIEIGMITIEKKED